MRQHSNMFSILNLDSDFCLLTDIQIFDSIPLLPTPYFFFSLLSQDRNTDLKRILVYIELFYVIR